MAKEKDPDWLAYIGAQFKKSPFSKKKDLELWEQLKATVKPLKKKTQSDQKIAAETAVPQLSKPKRKVNLKPALSPKAPSSPVPEQKRPQPKAVRQFASLLSQTYTPDFDRMSELRLKRGKREVDRKLDLHGKDLRSAHLLFEKCIVDSYEAGVRSLLIVTGKGDPEKGTGVIKSSFARWINEPGLRKYVLSSHPAKKQHGGEGAFYVLLRKKK